MDSSPKSYPIVNFVLSQIAALSPRSGSQYAEFDIEQPQLRSESDNVRFVDPLVEKMPHLKDPKVIAEMTTAISEIAKTRLVLEALGERPDHETVETAKQKVSEIQLSIDEDEERHEDCGPQEMPLVEIERKMAIEKEKQKERDMCKAVVQLDELHGEYQKLLKNAEKRLTKIYESAAATAEGSTMDEGPSEEMSEDVARILEQHAAGRGIENVDLSGTRLKHLPEAFGGIRGLVFLNLSNNHLQVLPETIAGLGNLQELNLSSNILEYLPDSIGFLEDLRTLNVSHNKLTSLPDSIARCGYLADLDASFNNLTYLPTNLGKELFQLKRLSLQYNKLRSLPTSIGKMISLQQLYVHFNELRDLNPIIGELTNLKIINLSGNFADFTELPETFGELVNLEELDLSNNQIEKLPDTFGGLRSLIKLNLDQNPLEIPPYDIVCQGAQAVVKFMAQRLGRLKEEEEEKNKQEAKEETETGWLKRSLSRSTSWLKQQVSQGSPRSPREMWLNQQL
ncbi:hypothetical protein V2J09_015022 [Rumex salicifolius]